MLTKEEYKELKDSFFNFMKKLLVEQGDLNPCIVLMGKKLANALGEEEESNAVVYVPIPGKYMKTEKTKEEFVTEVIPKMGTEIRQYFSIYAVAWVAEAWVREVHQGEVPVNWKDLPIQKEVLIITIETKDATEGITFEIKRNGKEVNAEGELIDHIELIEDIRANGFIPSGGRFSGLYKQFTESGTSS